MAERRKLEVGHNTIETGDDFAEGYANGYLYYYDTNRQLPRPFTDAAICSFMAENLLEQEYTPQWNAGFVLGWIEAFCENDATGFYTSIIMPDLEMIVEPLPVTLQET